MNIERIRPIIGGISTGAVRTGATGTIAVQAIDKITGEKLILSNAHIYSPEGAAAKGDIVTQPGPADGGDKDDRLGTLLRWIALNTVQEFTVDAAVARPDNPDMVSGSIKDIGDVAGITNPEPGQRVYKSGRTTGRTGGTITDISATLVVSYDIGKVRLTDLIVFKGEAPIVAGGDSGSLLVTFIDGQPYAVGLVFAGPANPPYDFGVACKIRNVLNTLNILLIPSQVESMPVQLYGKIIDLVSTSPIPSAHVFADKLAESYTDQDGYYGLGFELAGTYELSVAARGYYGGKYKIKITEGVNELSLALAPREELQAHELMPLLIGGMAGTITILGSIVGGGDT